MPNNRKIKEMTSLITQKDQIIAQMRAELSTTIEEDRYYTEENITDCNAHLEAFLAQLKKSNQATDKQTYLAEAIQTNYQDRKSVV